MNATLKQLESIDSGSNYKFGEKMESPSVPRSLFDLTHSNILTMKNAGQVVPLTWWECIQGDDYDISVDSLLRVLPQVVPLMSRQRLYVYAFYSRYTDLWNNYQVFMDRGYTGNVIKQIPCLQKDVNMTLDSNSQTVTADSLFDYMGLPIGATLSKLVGTSSSDKTHIRISALPFMMFLRIWRDYFMNRNEYINDRVILPDDDSRFRLDDNGELLSAKDNNVAFHFYENPAYDLQWNIVKTEYYFSGFYHEWPSDYFTSALPFTQRGNAPELKYNVDLSQLGVDFTNSIQPTDSNANSVDNIIGITHNSMSGDLALDTLHTDMSIDSGGRGLLNSLLSNGKVTGTFGLSIILEDIRKLAIAQTELEKLARTDGSYAQFGLTFFGEVSKAAYDFRPTYIGGTYKNIAFTEVLQTSSSTAAVEPGEDATPLGAMAGHGITGMSDNRIGHIHCDDNGIIMILGCIMPDVIYSEGIDRSFVESLQAEKYLPERSKLGLQPIYNYELYYAGNNSSSSGGDLYLWAHQNAFDHHRYKQNRIHGKIADPNSKSFYPFTQSRHFGQLVNWGRGFSEANNVRKSYLASSNEDAYVAQFKFNIRAVRPLPYRGTPAKII